MITNGNLRLSLQGHVNDMGVSYLLRSAPHMGFPTFKKYGFPIYVLFHERETPTFRKLQFLVTISLTLNYLLT